MDAAPGVPGVSKDAPGSTKDASRGLARKYCPQVEEYSKKSKKTMFFDDFFSILTVFCSFYILRAILAQKESSFICEKKMQFFGTHGTPGGVSI